MSEVGMHRKSDRCAQCCERQAICLCRNCQKVLCGVCAANNGLCRFCDGGSGSLILPDRPLPPLHPVVMCRELALEGV